MRMADATKHAGAAALLFVWFLGCSRAGSDPEKDAGSATTSATSSDTKTIEDGTAEDEEQTTSNSAAEEDTVSTRDSDSDTDTDADSDTDTDSDVDSADETNSEEGSDSEDEQDTDERSDSGTASDTTSESVDDVETEIEEATDTHVAMMTDTAVPTDTQVRVPVEQHTIEIEIVNETDEVKYLENFSQGSFMEIDLWDNGEWKQYASFSPPCLEYCEQVQEGESCCRPDDCEGQIPALFVLHPGDYVKNYWHGKLYEEDAAWCSDCPCKREVPVMSGAYRARICAFNELVCDNPEQCEEPPPTGVFMNGSVAGNSTCYAAKFDIFYEDEYLLIIISEDTIVVV